jgi:DNA-binding protein H-NS
MEKKVLDKKIAAIEDRRFLATGQDMPYGESLKALRARIRELESQAALLERAAKPGIAELQATITKYKLTPEDIHLALKGSSKVRQRGVPKGTRLKAKYRNPDNRQQTWAGRGLKPRWLTRLLRQGRKLEDLAI